MGFAGNGINAPHLYRSIDGGASWTNISSNLPNAPANSVVVDPNDANTVYVALDTGVYVTTQVSHLRQRQLLEHLWHQPAQRAGRPTRRRPRHAYRRWPHRRAPRRHLRTRHLADSAAHRAQPCRSPPSLSAPQRSPSATQAVATASAPQTVTVTNTGSAPLTISQIATTGDFTETDTCTAAPIAVGLTCTIQVRFLPTATGSRTGLLTVYGNVPGGQATATLSGTGTPPRRSF